MSCIFFSLGKLIGSHPWKVLIISLVITILICIAAPFTFTQTEDGDDTLWVPINANVLEYKSWVDTKYPSTVRFATMIFVSNNVLTPAVLSAVSLTSNCIYAKVYISNKQLALLVCGL